MAVALAHERSALICAIHWQEMVITRKEALETRGAEKRNCLAQHAEAAKYIGQSVRERQQGQAPQP